MNKFDSLLSSKKSSREESPIDKLLSKKKFSSDELLEELETGGFSLESFSEALLSYTKYTSDSFEKPKVFTKSFNKPNIKFTNCVDILNNNNTYLIDNINLVRDKIVDLLPSLEVIDKGTKNDRRLIQICDLYDWDLREDVDPESFNLYKFEGKKEKNKNGTINNAFRVFVGIKNITEDNKKISLLFIDPHHLAVPSRHRYSKNGPWIKGSQALNNTYTQCQYYEHHIYELIEEKLKVNE